MRLAIPLSLLILITVAVSQALTSQKQPCVAYSAGLCTSCPFNYHQYQNQCYRNITGCLEYSINSTGLLQCSQCNETISVHDGNGGCQLTISLSKVQTSVYYQELSTAYGDLRFQLMPLEQALSDLNFQVANNYMRNGQYKHFISRTTQPVHSVSTFNSGDKNEYKILYYGSGGGLMMCLISVNRLNSALILQAFVPIGVTSIVQNCSQYSLAVQCLQCVPGYHLQDGICIQNIEGCATYYRNICLSCSGYAVLLENRCLTGCGFLSDFAKILCYGDVRLLGNNWTPTLSRNYLL